MTAMAYVGRKSCGCPTYAASADKHRNAPLVRNGRFVRAGKWIDTEGSLSMTRVPVEHANVVICRCVT